MKSSNLKSFRDIQVDESNILSWTGLIIPVSLLLIVKKSCWNCNYELYLFKWNRNLCGHEHQNLLYSFLSKENPPYSKGAFRIEINFPAEYPFKPPKICFKTKIYHPNIDEKGQVCLPIISTENWKPATKTDQGIINYNNKLTF